MIASIKINLVVSEQMNINTNMSSLLHGFIMENISSEFAEKMHLSNLRPYSQSLIKTREGKWIWKVNTLNDYAYDNIILKLKEIESIYLKYKDMTINVESNEIITTNFDELFEKNYFENANSRYIDIEFLTPVSFRSSEKYVNIPKISLLMSSLINKYDFSSDTTSIYNEDLIAEMLKNIEILRYNLRSIVFCLEGVEIPSFIGKMTLKINGSRNIANLCNMLFEFGQYSGIGIKCALGMGTLLKIERKGS